MASVPGEEKVYHSVDIMADSDAVPLPTEVLNKIEISGVSAHQIRLNASPPRLVVRRSWRCVGAFRLFEAYSHINSATPGNLSLIDSQTGVYTLTSVVVRLVSFS